MSTHRGSIDNPQHNLHCPICFQHGGKIMRYWVNYRYNNSHVWVHNFPCRKSMDEHLDAIRPFITINSTGTYEEN